MGGAARLFRAGVHDAGATAGGSAGVCRPGGALAGGRGLSWHEVTRGKRGALRKLLVTTKIMSCAGPSGGHPAAHRYLNSSPSQRSRQPLKII